VAVNSRYAAEPNAQIAYAHSMQTDLRYERWFLPFSVPFDLGPQRSDVRIEGDSLHVSMGWGFTSDIPLSSITEAKPYTGRVTAWGVHGWRGRRMVNGSSTDWSSSPSTRPRRPR